MLYTRCKVLTEEGTHIELCYYITCSDTSARKYGVCIEMSVDGTPSRAETNALFFTVAEATAFAEMLAYKKVTPETLGDIAADWM